MRTPDLAGFRGALIDVVRDLPPALARHTFVLVPSAAAAEQLRRTLEDHLLGDRAAVALPVIGTRAAFYHALATRLPQPPDLLSSFEREVIFASAARAADDRGAAAPFRLRPSLIAEIVALYDHVRRLGRSVADFERNFRAQLEPAVDFDRGAAKLLEQTAFLALVFAEYESRAGSNGLVDEHALRARLLAEPSPRPLHHAIVTVGDRTADPDGLWPADFDLLARLPGLERLDLLATEGVLAAGLLGRLHAAFPGLDETHTGPPAAGPRLIVPPAGPGGRRQTAFVSRDREEELTGVARRVKAEQRQPGHPPLERTALLVHRPLPYLYLARDLFAGAGIPFETLDTLPLAAEPYAGAVDLALDWVIADFTRQTTTALLRSPHFRFIVEDEAEGGVRDVTPADVAQLDAALAEARHLGGLERCRTLLAAWAGAAARAALSALDALAPLAATRPMVEQIECLLAFLQRFDRPSAPDDPEPSRRQRVRAAVVGALTALAAAYRRHDPEAPADASALSAAVRRWLGARTFAARSGSGGLQIVDAQAARYGTFDDVQLAGLIDGEWPERPRRPVFFPASLMGLLEPVSADPTQQERDAAQAARASFVDLLRLSRGVVRVSTVLLENDAVVEPSMLLDEIPAAGLETVAAPALPPARIFQHEAMSREPYVLAALPPETAAWARVRTAPRDGDPARFHGAIGAWRPRRISVSRLERYLDCPFRYYSSEVLALEEELEDEDTRTPLERGRFLHELFEEFFTEWQRRGHARIDRERMDEARRVFAEVCERKLAALPAADAALERVRLEGSAVGPGIAHRVFEMEADRPQPIVERLLEYAFEGAFTFTAQDGSSRRIALRGTADRIDLLADGTLRVVDYKSNKTPDPKRALQLPIYSLCARERLDGYRQRQWAIGEAAYLSFEGDRAVVPLRQRDQTLADLIAAAEDRLLHTLESIEAGRFPPRPARKSLCATCAFAAVCRKDWVEDEDE